MSNMKTFFRNLAVKALNVTDHFSLGGTEVTATAAELNALHNAALTAAQATDIANAIGTQRFDALGLVRVVNIAGGATTVAASQFTSAVLVHRVMLDITTKATAACSISVGVANAASTTDNTLLDTLDVGTAAGLFDNITDKGSAGKSRQIVTANQYITARVASGASAGLVGKMYIFYTPRQ